MFYPSANVSIYIDSGPSNISLDSISDAPTGGADSVVNNSGSGSYVTNSKFTGNVQDPFLPVFTPALTTLSLDSGTGSTALSLTSLSANATLAEIDNTNGGKHWAIFSAGTSAFFGAPAGTAGFSSLTDSLSPFFLSDTLITDVVTHKITYLQPSLATAPTGSCSAFVNGTLAIAVDGHASSCAGTTWTSRW